VKPALTSEASLKYFDEEAYFKTTKKNPQEYNDIVIIFSR
jgi:hypothetical protein